MASRDLVWPVGYAKAPDLFARGPAENVVQFPQAFGDLGDVEARPGTMSKQGSWEVFGCTYCKNNETEDGENIENLHPDNLRL
jgi:hypothetical protein